MVGSASGRGHVRRRFAPLASACVAATMSASVVAAPHLAEIEFQRLNPCPSNHARQGACPGYAIEHVVPLCLGGPDVAYNMRWQRSPQGKPADPAATRDCR